MEQWWGTLDIKTVNVRQRVISGYAAAHNNLDRMRDIIDPQASVKAMARIKDPARDVVALVGHDGSGLPVGIPQRIEVTPQGLFTETYVLKGPVGDNLLAVAKDLHDHGQALGMSIGYKTHDSRVEHTARGRARRILDYELKEYSFASHQAIANPMALTTSVKTRRTRATGGQKALGEGSDTAGGLLVPAQMPSKKGVKGMQYRVNAMATDGPWQVICDVDADGDVNDNRVVGTYQSQDVANAVALALRREALEDNEDGPDEDTAPDAEDAIMSTQDKTTAPDKSTEKKAVWTTKYMNDLPDSSFLYIEPGGKKDGDGKTVPRDLRHFPVKDANGKVDMAHVRDAIGRIPQAKGDGLDDAKKAELQARARRMLGNADDGKTYEEPLEWKTGSPITAFGLSCRLADIAEKIAEEHRAMSLLGEDTKSYQRIRPALREELVAVAKEVGKMVEWATTIDAGADAEARLAWHRQRVALASL